MFSACDEGCTAELMESTDALLAMEIHTNFSGIKIALPYKRMRDLYNSSRVLRVRSSEPIPGFGLGVHL